MRGRSASALRKYPRPISTASAAENWSPALRYGVLHASVRAKLSLAPSSSEPQGPRLGDPSTSSSTQSRVVVEAAPSSSLHPPPKKLCGRRNPLNSQPLCGAEFYRDLKPPFAVRYNMWICYFYLCDSTEQHRGRADTAHGPATADQPIFPRPFSIPTSFLIVRPKRLKIAVTPTKQPSPLISNRIKIDPPQNAFHYLNALPTLPFSLFPFLSRPPFESFHQND
jgi:hypothetical protein